MDYVLEPPALPRRQPAPADPTLGKDSVPAPPAQYRPVRAPYPQARAPGDRAQMWVRLTLFVVVLALLIFSIALPIPGPRRDVAASERRFVEVRLGLSEIRAVLADFRADHNTWPGQGQDGVGDPGLLTDQLVRPTGRNGVVLANPTGGGRLERALGPYRRDGVPANPVNGLTSVRLLRADEPFPDDGDGLTGWLYRPSTGEIRANLAGRAFESAPRYVDL